MADRPLLKLLPEVLALSSESLAEYIESRAIRIVERTQSDDWRGSNLVLPAVELAHALVRIETLGFWGRAAATAMRERNDARCERDELKTAARELLTKLEDAEVALPGDSDIGVARAAREALEKLVGREPVTAIIGTWQTREGRSGGVFVEADGETRHYVRGPIVVTDEGGRNLRISKTHTPKDVITIERADRSDLYEAILACERAREQPTANATVVYENDPTNTPYPAVVSHAASLANVDNPRGCPSCGKPTFAYQLNEPDLEAIGDARNRTWHWRCVQEALANVRRRVDERTDYDYPWRFEDTGGIKGQHIRTTIEPVGPCAHEQSITIIYNWQEATNRTPRQHIVVGWCEACGAHKRSFDGKEIGGGEPQWHLPTSAKKSSSDTPKRSLHLAWIGMDPESLRRGASTRTAVCLCGWAGPQRATLEMCADDAIEHEKENPNP